MVEQHFAANKKRSFATYEEARAVAMEQGEDMDHPRRRIRYRRSTKNFELVHYKELPKKKEEGEK